MSDHPAVVTILALAAIAAALATLWKTIGAPAHRLGKRVAEFLDDWNGEPARPGRPAIKPMPARIASLEEKIECLSTKMHTFQDESSADRADLRARLEELGSEPPDRG